MKVFSEESALQLSEMLLQNDKDIKEELERKIPTNYISSIPSEYVTESEMNEAISNAQIGGDGNVDLSGYATETFVEDKIAEIEIPSLDGYAKIADVPTVTNDLTNELKSDYDDAVDKMHTHINKEVLDGITSDKIASWDAKATESFVANAIAQAQLDSSDVDLSGLATKDDLETKADKSHTHILADITDYEAPDLTEYALKSEIPTDYLSSIPDEYVTEDEMTEAINNAKLESEPVDLSDYAKKTEIPTTLPASDVYDWAKSETKPEYTADEVGALPNTTVIPSVEGLISEETLNTTLTDYAKITDVPNNKDVLETITEENIDTWNAGGVSDEQIATAVGDYMTENPVSAEVGDGTVTIEKLSDDVRTKIENTMDSFFDNIHVDYEYDSETNANYTIIRVYRDRLDGTKQYPHVFVPTLYRDSGYSTLDMNKLYKFPLAINAGYFTADGVVDGIAIQNGTVVQSSIGTLHAGNKPLTINASGELGYVEADVSANTILEGGIISCVTGFMPIVKDYAAVSSNEWNSVSHYTQNAQRQIIGQFGNGDYAIITCEGRNCQNSDGWTIEEAQQICIKHGLKFAYNLDGGGSTETVLGQKHINTIYENETGRKIGVFIVFNGSTELNIIPPSTDDDDNSDITDVPDTPSGEIYTEKLDFVALKGCSVLFSNNEPYLKQNNNIRITLVSDDGGYRIPSSDTYGYYLLKLDKKPKKIEIVMPDFNPWISLIYKKDSTLYSFEPSGQLSVAGSTSYDFTNDSFLDDEAITEFYLWSNNNHTLGNTEEGIAAVELYDISQIEVNVTYEL